MIEGADPDQFRVAQFTNRGIEQMKKLTSGMLSLAVATSIIMAGGVGVAHADSGPRPVVQSAQVNPLEEARSKCIMSKSKGDCAYLMSHTKMNEMVRECLLKGAIGGAGALIIGRFVSKDVAKDIAAKTVVAGATGCLAALA